MAQALLKLRSAFSAVVMVLAATPLHGAASTGSDLDALIKREPLWARDCKGDISGIEQRIQSLASTRPPYSVETVLKPLNAIESRLANGASFASLMENVHPDAAIRENAAECTAAYADIATRLSLSRPVFEAVSAVPVADAAPDTRRYLQLTMQGFRLAGVDRDEATRKRIREINEKLTKLGQDFDRNILEDVRYIEVTADQLAGLPDDFIASKKVGENGKIRLSTRYVDTVPVYTYAHSDEVRKLLREKDRSRGYPENAGVLKQMLELRYELARLLDFDNFANYITADKMIGSASNALRFIDRIHILAEPAAQRDVAELLVLLRKTDPGATEVQRWQSTYLEELIRQEKYEVSSTELRQYFSYPKVRDGIFNLVEHLFDVTITPWETETWDAGVSAHEIRQDGKVLGRFYMDMHPRDGKYQHAAAFVNQVGIEGEQLPVSTLVCNFVGGEDPNASMEYSEVRTFLHEFGHLLHSIFGGHQRWARLSGIATEWDFVEAPSQMLEEWMYDTETLQTFAVNDRGEAIPSELVDKLRAARDFGEGAQTNVQMYYSALSLEYHRLPPGSLDLVEEMLALEKKYSPFPHQEDTYFFANLGHLNGYSAIYYTYMWSKVIAVDMFSEFEKHGVRDKATAKRYRDKVLVPGGSKPAAELVKDFLGRPYNFEAFSQRLRTDP